MIFIKNSKVSKSDRTYVFILLIPKNTKPEKLFLKKKSIRFLFYYFGKNINKMNRIYNIWKGNCYSSINNKKPKDITIGFNKRA